MKFNPLKIVPKFWQKKPPPSTEIISQPSPSELKQQKREEIIKWLAALGTFLIGLAAIPVTIIKIVDEVSLLFSSEKFACDTVTFEISKNLKEMANCDPISSQGIDAVILFNKDKDKLNSPKIQLMVDYIYDLDITFDDFSKKQEEEAKKWSNKKNEFIYAIYFKNHNAYKLVYDNNKLKRLDILFLYKRQQYIIRYEASIEDFNKYKNDAEKIINSLEITQKGKEKQQ